MDNVRFQVGGFERKDLEDTIALAMKLSKCSKNGIEGWWHSPEKGIIFLRSTLDFPDSSKFPGPMKKPRDIASFVESYLDGPLCMEVDMEKCPGDEEHEIGAVSNKLGWLVYVEDWGRVAGLWQSAFAVCPHYLWSGK